MSDDIIERVLGWQRTIIPFRWIHITIIEYYGDDVGAKYKYKWSWRKPVDTINIRDTLPQLQEFDWLRDYGPMWHPATTAFWLAPTTENEVRAWYRKYRPDEAYIIYGPTKQERLAMAYQQGANPFMQQQAIQSQISQQANLNRALYGPRGRDPFANIVGQAIRGTKWDK